MITHSLNNLSLYTSNHIALAVRSKADASTTDSNFINTSNWIDITSNVISERIDNLSLDNINNGTTNKFIVNDTYTGGLTVDGDLTVSGTTSTLNTSVYTTESLEIVSSSLTEPALKINETGTQNIVELDKDSVRKVTIDNDGNVGIGTTNPTEKLEVAGNLKVSGTINSGDLVTTGIATNIGGIELLNINKTYAVYVSDAGDTNSFNGGNACDGYKYRHFPRHNMYKDTSFLEGIVVELKSSTRTDYSNHSPWKSFIGNANTHMWASAYVYDNGIPRNTYLEGYAGEWLMIDLGETIILKQFRMHTAPYSFNGMPKKFRVYATNNRQSFIDETVDSWNLLFEGGFLNQPTYFPYGENFDIVNDNGYRYYVFIFNELFPGASRTHIGYTVLYGYNNDMKDLNTNVLRLRTENSTNSGIIYETSDEECKFSIRASDGKAFFAGDVVTDGDITINGNVKGNLMLDQGNVHIKGGILNIYNTQSQFIESMKPGSLVLGDVYMDYGNDTIDSLAGILLTCKDKTEIAIHDSLNRVHSLISYTYNAITIGRNMGWGAALSVIVNGNLTSTGTVTGSGNYVSNFTGVHNCVGRERKIYDKRYVGYIVRSCKKYKSINSKYNSSNIKQNIDKEVNDCLPMVELSMGEKDKNVFGVISKVEDEESLEREQSIGSLISKFERERYDRRLHISGCGEGFIWVSDYNGEIEAGDLITSSPIPGIGMKQEDDLVHSYTVAKITMDCDFNPEYIPVEVIRSSNYEVEYIGTSNIILGWESKETSNVEYQGTSNVEYKGTSNVIVYPKDEEGEYIYENEYDEKGEIVYDYEYEMRYVRLDGTIITKEEYENSSNAYRMALVGSSYKCS